MFRVTILTPAGHYDTLELTSITLPTYAGQQTVLSHHMALLVQIEPGVMITKAEHHVTQYAVSEGLFAFEENEGNLLVAAVESEAELDFNRAEQARTRAQKRLKNEDHELIDMKRAEYSLKRSLARLRLKP